MKFRSRKELALLIYLVVEGGQHSREKLMALLWPDSDRQRGQASLRNTLVRLRQGLAGAESYLIVEPDRVGFDFGQPFELDLNALQIALPTFQKNPKPADLSPLQAATLAYRGDFLEGFSLADAPQFDDWAALQREAWHHRLQRIFNQLSRLKFEEGQIEQALEITRQWLVHDPLNEAAHRRLMQLYFLTGNRTAALQAFEQCRRILVEELGVEPDVETAALAERIRMGTPPTPVPKEAELALLPQELPFVGRAGEHSQLVTLYGTVSQRKPQVVCVVGEAGIGKTRLSQTFLAWVTLQEADILRGRAFEAGGQLPYQPLIEALRERLERENAPDDLLADLWLAELSQLLPELRERYPDLPPATAGDPNFARSRLFEAVARLGQALAERKPVILFIDDIQWADAATLDILPYLSRRWAEGQSRILLLLTLRREALVTTPPLREWLAQLEREVSLTRLQLPPLPVDAIQQLVRSLAAPVAEGHQTTQQFSAWLFAETAGQPFFMAETIKMLVEQDILPSAYQPDGQWTVDFELALQQLRSQAQIALPPNVREVILTRLGRLSETARALLVTGAVLGRACRFERLCQVSGVGELEGLPALDELLRSQVLLETTDLQHPYTFAHDKIRDVVYTEAGDARRRIYHRQAFVALEADSAPAAELAHHALAARLVEPALRYNLGAGDEAVAVYAYSEAIRHYSLALDIAKQDYKFRGATDEALTKLYLRLGRTQELNSHHEQALITYREMEKTAQSHNDQVMELAALMAQITPLAAVTAAFDPAQAETLSERALQLAQALGDQTAQAKILWNQLLLYRNTNRAPEAVACGEGALALARQLNLQEQMAFILNDLGYCFAFMADFKRAGAAFHEVSGLWRGLNNVPMLADSLTGACLVSVFTGEYEAAINFFEQAFQFSQTMDSVWGLAGCRHNIGYVYREQGQIDRAIFEMAESIRLSDIIGFISPLIIVRADLAILYGVLGAFERGLEISRLAVNIAEDKMPVFRLYALVALTQLQLWQDHLSEAEALVGEMKNDPHKGGWGIYPPLILQAEAELALRQGKGEQARVLAEEALTATRQLGARAFLPYLLYLQGQIWLALDNPGAAHQALTQAYAEAEALGARRTRWKILASLAEIEAQRGNDTGATQLRQEAGAILDYIIAHIREDYLRTSFLALLEVRELLASI